ncbi:hypothetical protein GAY29_31235, partial [Azospirillum brasilense]|uniref:DUF6440 family protein n=1 Tax=Azospirillum brasilense TaxID=192 RepID=UPI00190A88B3
MDVNVKLPPDFERRISAAVVKAALIAALVFGVLTSIRNGLSIGVDDSDMDGWRRSGVAVHTDHKTGLQYLAAPGGGITPHLDKSGRPMHAGAMT